jgi:amino-acid N-acetyltransferase
MKLTPRIIRNKKEKEKFLHLLREAGLPTSDVDGIAQLLIGYYDGPEMVGTGGLEFYREGVLIRSVSLRPTHRGRSLGRFIVNDLLTITRGKNARAAYLLTETATEFFKALGFQEIPRDNVPPELRKSSEFRDVCPASAVAMHANLAVQRMTEKVNLFFL